MRLDSVVIGIDFSAASIDTAQWVAATLAANAEIVLVHVIEPPPRSAFLVVDTPVDLLETEARAEAENELKEVARRIGRVTRMEVRVGRASTAIAQLATDCGADLIVVGADNANWLERRLLGAIHERVVDQAGCAVLVTPPPERDTLRRWGGASASGLGGQRPATAKGGA